jgi:hypothetical protein
MTVLSEKVNLGKTSINFFSCGPKGGGHEHKRGTIRNMTVEMGWEKDKEK